MKTLPILLAFVIAAGCGSVAIAAQASPPRPAQPKADPGVEEQRRAFLEDIYALQAKPAQYDVTIVEYFDYQCPYCRLAHDALRQLTATDKKVRVVFRDWPIFGSASQRAARVAIASRWQGKHAAMHDALMATPRPLTEDSIRAAAKRAGVDWTKLQSDLSAHGFEIQSFLNRNSDQAEELGFEGTPDFIIGNKVYQGGFTLKQLRQAVAEARRDSAPRKIVSHRPNGI